MNLNDRKHDIKRWLGIEHHEKTHVTIETPSDDPETITVGPFVKTNRPMECDDCGERTRYFHRYLDSRGLFPRARKRYRCHECHIDTYGESSKVPAIENGEVNPSKTWVYDTIDPREVF